jgi:ribosomal protein S21
MVEVKRRKNEDIDRLLFRFKRAFNNSGKAHELKRRRYYKKPSELKNFDNEKIKFRKKKRKEQREDKIKARRRRKRITFSW